MSPSRRLAHAILVIAALCPPGFTEAQAQDEARRTAEMPDEMLDALLFKDIRGQPGSAKRTKLLAELHPDFYAELRRLTRRMLFAKPEEAPIVMSDLEELNGRIVGWLQNEARRAPLRALDSVLATIRGRLPTIERTDPRICGVYIWGTRPERMQLNEALPNVGLAFDLAYYQAAAAARNVPTAYPAIDETMMDRFGEALIAAGVPQERLMALFDADARAALTPAERCDFERRFMETLAGLPDEIRGPILTVVLNGDGGVGE